MHIRLILQPFEGDFSLYDMLREGLADERMNEFTVVVAWAKESGLRRLRPLVQAFRARGGTARILLGIDEGGATVEGLRAAIDDFDEALVLFDPAPGTFHPKIYLFDGDDVSTLLVASSNLTAGGLFANYEAGTCLELDLTQEADKQVRQAMTDYIDRLLEDETSRPLTEELMRQLIENPGFGIHSEAKSHGAGHGDAGDKSSLFGKSSHDKKSDPFPFPRSSTPAVVAHWSKKLSRSDSGRPREGSQTTAALRFTKAGQAIDQAHWFRDELFGDEQWQPDARRVGREVADARFDVTINGIPRGTHELRLKHDAVREAGQHNFTTDLKWGSLSPVLRSEDLTGKWVTVEKLSDGTLRLTVADVPVLDLSSAVHSPLQQCGPRLSERAEQVGTKLRHGINEQSVRSLH